MSTEIAMDQSLEQVTRWSDHWKLLSWVILGSGLTLTGLAWTWFPWPLLAAGGCATAALWLAMRGFAVQYGQAARMAQRLSRQARTSEKHLRAVIDHTVDGILTLDEHGQILSANPAACEAFGYTEDDMVGSPISQVLPVFAHQSPADTISNTLQAQQIDLDGRRRRFNGRHRDQHLFPLDLAFSVMEVDGQSGYVGILRDLSAQQAAEASFHAAQRQLNEVDEMRRVIVHNAPYGIFVLSRLGRLQSVNPAGEALLGSRSADLLGQAHFEQFLWDEEIADRARLLALRLNRPVEPLHVLQHLAVESPGLPSEWTMVRSDGRHLTVELTVTVLRDDAGTMTGYLAMAYDVTSRRDAERQLQHLALHDALTGLPNRNMVQEQLKSAVMLAERDHNSMALMFIDLDRFKKINDTLGHHMGDSVLIEVARRIRAEMRTSDIVARLGGDEFVVMLPRIALPEDGVVVAEKVLSLFAEPLHVGPHELRVTPSIGLVIYPTHGHDAVTLMRHADLAMYQAKNRGRNRIQMYAPTMDAARLDSLQIENELYGALERQELRLHYQPQFECTSGRITGAEALLRWERGGRLIPPTEFIPLAEETGLIVEIGEWVLREACMRAQAWRTQCGWPLRISVNLSAVQLEQPDMIGTVARALQDSGLPPTALELEITESVIVRESLRAADVLQQLRSLGVSIAIDDFGVGYSSFAYLRELPVDRFKLDRSFLSGVPQSSGDSRLLAALIAMGHRLEVGIVAEGVETAAQQTFLRDHGCDELQGYHLSRPLAQDAFEALLLAHSQDRLARELLTRISERSALN